MQTNRSTCMPLGVVLSGSLASPLSKRINSWDAFYAGVRIVIGLRTRALACAAAWGWYERTPSSARDHMLQVQAREEACDTICKAADIVDANGNGRLAMALREFADEMSEHG
jgi:hypothetical protein